MLKPILIFDFDGTIADTHHYIVEISNRLSEEFKYRLIKLEELDKLKDKTTEQVIRHLRVPVFKIPAIMAKAKKEFHKGIEQIHPIAGLKEAVLQLKANHVQMGILSSNSKENILKFLENHEMNVFDFIHPSPKVWSKNTCLKQLIEKHNLNHKNVIYVGDEIRDVKAARKIGLKVAAVCWGYNSARSLQKHKPDYLIASPLQLLELCGIKII